MKTILPNCDHRIHDTIETCWNNISITPTSDSLGIGGILLDLANAAQLWRYGGSKSDDRLSPLIDNLIECACQSLSLFPIGMFKQNVSRRLAFREFGMVKKISIEDILRIWGIGLKSLSFTETYLKNSDKQSQLKKLIKYQVLVNMILDRY